MNKRFALCTAVCSLFVPLYAASMSARQIADEAASKADTAESIAYLKSSLASAATSADRRAVYAFLGAVQEQLAQFDDARDSYAAAAGIAAGDAKDMPAKSSEQLVLDAVRCALSTGDYATADSYLNSAVRSSNDETIQAYVKLYTEWSSLCRADDVSGVNEPIIILKAYSELPSMAAIKPAVLLTLWYVTGDEGYAGTLKKQFPKSPEAAIVSGTVSMLPAPFWYFVPRLGAAQPQIADEGPDTPVEAAVPDAQTSDSSADSGNHVIRQQLGLFREKANAQDLVQQLKKKGFTGVITTEKRPSGTTYFIVVVDENPEGSMGAQLRTAGFECYPIFSDKQ